MDNKLLQKLMEEDLFPSATPEEIKDREANRPLRVLAGAELDEVLKQTLCFVIKDLGEDEIIDSIMHGTSIAKPGVAFLGAPDLIKGLTEWIPAYRSEVKHANMGTTSNEQTEKIILHMIQKYAGEKFDKIEGF